MPPNPEAICPYDFWQKFDSESEALVELTCFMPNGIVFFIHLGQNASLQEIKEEIWEEAEQYPLYGSLRDKSEYALSAICNKGYTVQTDEILDESKRLRDVQPYFNIIKVTERSTISNNVLNKNIEELIGKPIQELRDTGSPEVNDFRFKMGAIAEDISKDRFNNTFHEKLMYQFPPRLARSKDIPKTIRGRLAEDKFMLVSKFENDDNSFTHKVSFTITPQQLLEKILAKKELTMNKRFERLSEFILKVCGQDEYIYGEHPIIQFLYIQDTLSRDGVPQLVIQSKQNINLAKDIEYEPMVYPVIETKKSVSGEKAIKRKKVMTSWELDVPYQVTITEIGSLNSYTNKNIEIALQAGLFHGGKSLCKPQSTNIVPTLLQEIVEFKHTLVFDIHLPNLPRTARLCIVLFEILKSAKGQNRRRVKINNKDYFINPLGWVNTTVFDFKNNLKIDGLTLYTWSWMEESDSLFNPLGTIESNPRKENDGAAIIVQLSRYTNADALVILYPSEEKILSHANMLAASKNLNRDSAQDTRSIEEIMAPYANNNRINEMHDQERNAIWAKRTDCLINLPERVPCLLHCVEWNDRDEVSEMISLLQRWPSLSVESALELLDYAYADPIVRTFAVQSLLKLKDEELLLYLLQLVQAIKHEPYSSSALVEFLLLRGLHNQRIGHHLFWHLRSEMHVPAVQIRYGIIIEAYLKGSQQHVPILLRQKACVDELKKAAALAKRGSKDKARAQLYEYLEKPSVKLIISNFVCPLNPSFRCKEIQLDKCKVMDSKMRPLWIVFDNHDSHGDEICLIYKDGDDLRQDMLTLQMLRVMDRIWKDHGYDFRMNPYNCASTERRSGLIEVVLNAETIANIQKERGMFSATSPFKKGSLHAWLKEHNPTDELDKAIHEFTLSCAGYCVATYVLGVADRHSDNIMVKRTGQLFHVDFGHILGHFKEKFGFRRERVPFVLTHDFVYVINKGKTDRETDEFRTFKTLCEKAFLLLREHGCLILSLFSMMISTGLPELSSEKDLNYLRETLVLDLSEEEACEHFRSKFSEALLNSWKTSLNWASHNFSKNNKQ